MPDPDKIEELLQKLAPCIECGELEKCVEEAARLAKEMGIKAEEYYKKAIELDPKLAITHSNYAGLLRDSGRFYEAEKEVRIALQIEPTSPYALGTLGDILSDEEYYEDAEKEYKKALENSASMEASAVSEIYNNLGSAYANLKKYGDAKKQFQKAISIDTMNIKAARNLRALGKVGDKTSISKSQVCILTLIIFYHQLARVKIGPIEFEKSEEHRFKEAKRSPAEAKERF